MTEKKITSTELAELLEGTCSSIEDHVEDVNAFSIAFMDELDNLVMCCVVCGWWEEIGFMNTEDEPTCMDCKDG